MERVLVLTAAAGVPDRLVARALAVGASTPRRLAATAVELSGDIARAAAAMAGQGVDANLVPVANRRKRLLIADMDSTIIDAECIDEIAGEAGLKAEVAAITERAMRGELDFEQALTARVALIRGLPEAALERVWRERIHLNPGARTLAATMNAAGAMTALVSGGFTWFSRRVAEVAGFRFHRANTLIFEEGRLTGAVALPILGRQAKLETLLALAAETGITPDDAIAVGDGANDLAMVEAAGLGVAYRAKPALAAGADARIEHGDLTALLSLQGYEEAEYAA
ncbi:MAG TPA: phosphoserine phosphatase SerB [Paracoccaceae bacterium]|nr:phosphoserine phosphatase SerB [Paracoccaceae bacterium]